MGEKNEQVCEKQRYNLQVQLATRSNFRVARKGSLYFGLSLIADTVVFNILQYVDLYNEWSDWGHISESISVIFIYSSSVLKVPVFYTRRREITEIAKEMHLRRAQRLARNNDESLRLLQYYERRRE